MHFLGRPLAAYWKRRSGDMAGVLNVLLSFAIRLAGV